MRTLRRFNSILRRECLSQHWHIDLDDAERSLRRWKEEYNNFRPHGSLDRSTPADFAAVAPFTQDPDQLENLQDLVDPTWGQEQQVLGLT